jgi:hypothetical protein
MKGLTDAEVEKEIARLRKSEYVKLAQKKMRNDYRRRQQLYGLRDLEKKGKKLADAGITMEMLKNETFDEEEN